ncbi:MAG: hypothetical protein IK086_08005, partial [Clostridia bacterium]|nr:hypothetical protein [Clostridia bacterium]
KASVGIKGYGLLILITGKKVFSSTGEYAYVPEDKRVIDCEENPKWVYMPEGAGYAITDYDIRVSYLGKTKKFKKHKYSRIRELIGTQDDIYRKTYVIPYFDTASRPKSMYPCKAVYRADVPYVEGYDSVLFDGGTFTGEFKLVWNGKVIDKNQIKRHRVYDAENYIFKPEFKKAKNRLKIYFENAGEFDGVNGEIYLYGDKNKRK